MAWLKVPDDTATPELELLTEPWRKRGERVPPVIAVLKSTPRAFEAVLGLNYALSFGASSLGRRQEELIAVWVSALNGCYFCLTTHARYLEAAWGANTDELFALLPELRELAGSFRDRPKNQPESLSSELAALALLSASECALLAFVARITLHPQASAAGDYTELHRAGFSETEILDGLLIASCFAFMNRLACATGIALEESKYAAAERMFGRAALEQHLAETRRGEANSTNRYWGDF
jgi:AhpD family alkylhydroperoxidase